jgi:hypothetical protein
MPVISAKANFVYPGKNVRVLQKIGLAGVSGLPSMKPAIKLPNSVIPACPVEATLSVDSHRESFRASQRDSRLPKAFGIAGMTMVRNYFISIFLNL